MHSFPSKEAVKGATGGGCDSRKCYGALVAVNLSTGYLFPYRLM